MPMWCSCVTCSLACSAFRASLVLCRLEAMLTCRQCRVYGIRTLLRLPYQSMSLYVSMCCDAHAQVVKQQHLEQQVALLKQQALASQAALAAAVSDRSVSLPSADQQARTSHPVPLAPYPTYGLRRGDGLLPWACAFLAALIRLPGIRTETDECMPQKWVCRHGLRETCLPLPAGRACGPG